MLLGQPCLGLGLAYDTPDDHSLRFFLHLVEDAIVVSAQPVRRNNSPDQALDPRLALQGRVHAQDPSALIGDPSGIGCPQRPQLVEGFDGVLQIVGHQSSLRRRALQGSKLVPGIKNLPLCRRSSGRPPPGESGGEIIPRGAGTFNGTGVVCLYTV